MKYKLVKEYPNSPKLGTIHCSEPMNEQWLGYNTYDKFSEFWKPVLLTTEDSVDLIEKDEFWAVNLINNNNISKFIVTSFTKKDKNFLDFSTKELAQQYVNRHKKLYSIQDILDACIDVSSISTGILIDLNRLKQ